MKKVKIITDSMSDIPRELAQNLNITVLPLTIRFGNQEYKDGIDMTPQEFYKKVENFDGIPSTSQVPPSDFQREMEKALNEGYEHVIVINGSGEASGTHQSAQIAKQQLEMENIHVIDSRALSYGCGMIVVEAAKMAIEGKNVSEILEEVGKMVKGAEQIFTVGTLKYLHMNGRLSTAKMALGTLLNVKPVLAIVDGKVEPLDKVRGSKKLIKRMIEISMDRGLKEGAKIGLGHIDNYEGLKQLKEEVIKEINPAEITEIDIGCTIGSHAGPGTLSIFFIEK